MCRPQLKGFFNSKLFELLLSGVLYMLVKKKPYQLGAVSCSLGCSQLIVLPVSTKQLQQKSLLEREQEILKGVKLAHKLKVKKIAFAGLIPSYLNHFKSLKTPELLTHKHQLITGQTMTCVAIVSLIKQLLKKTKCRVLSVVGLGAIGSLSLRLMLEKSLNPQKIILCDLTKNTNKLKQLAQEIQNNYSIPVELAFYKQDSFLKVYQGDVILGAVSSKKILNPKLLKKGAFLVDDSFPPIVSLKASRQRMQTQKDLLILSGGKLIVPHLKLSCVIPFSQFLLKSLYQQGLPGCWLEALVAFYLTNANLPATHHDFLSNSHKQALLKAWELKQLLGLKLPPFHLFSYPISKKLTEKVYQLRKS